MRIYSKILCAVLACVVFMSGLSLLTVSADTYIIDGDYKISRDAAGITVHGYLGKDPEIVLPDTFVGQTVVAVNEYAFIYNTTLKSVSMPISIVNVDRGVFYECTSLEYAELPKNCATVGQYLFYGCTSLKTVVLPDVLKEVPRYCFSRCSSLEKVSLPSTTKVIGDYAFANCPALQDVYVSKYTNSISDTAFENSPQVVIHGYLNTYAHEYAMEHGIPFSLIDEPPQTFYVTFLNYDGSVFWKTPVAKGGSVKYPLDIPTKPSTDTHYYEFSNWSGNVVNVQENEFLTPVFKEFRIKGEDEPDSSAYSVVFLDGDGTFMEMQAVKEKEAAVAPQTVPEKTPTAQYYYTFTGWDTDFSDVRENLVVRPTFSEHLREYTVTFTDVSGEGILSKQTVTYGGAATAPEAPEMEGFLFAGWDREFDNITTDITVKPLYEEIPLPPEPEEVYYVVVFLGFDGRYISNQVVKEGESATEPQVPAVEEFKFIGWNVDFSAVNSDLVVRALFERLPASPDEPVPEEKSYIVTFVDYDGKYLSSQIVKEGESAEDPKSPDRPGYEFIGWDSYTGSIYCDLTVKAIYEKLPVPPESLPKTGLLKIEIAGGSGFSISVNYSNAKPQGTSYRNSTIPIGVPVDVTAGSVAGEEFIGWVNPVTGMVLSTSPYYSFITSGNDSLNAIFATPLGSFRMVTFVNDKAGANGRILDMQYYSTEDEIIFPDAPTQVGFDFAGWSMTDAEIKAAIAEYRDVTVTALWTRRIVPVNVTVNGGTGTGSYNANTAVTVVADEPTEGQKFAYWTDVYGNIKSYNREYKFYPVEDTELYAVFVPDEEYIERQIIVSIDYIDTVTEPEKNIFTYSWYCPEEFEFVKAGILAVNKDNYNEETFYAGTSDGNVYDRTPSGGTLKAEGSGAWTKSAVTTGQVWVAVAYVQYRDLDGGIITVYSDVAEAVKI